MHIDWKQPCHSDIMVALKKDDLDIGASFFERHQ